MKLPDDKLEKFQYIRGLKDFETLKKIFEEDTDWGTKILALINITDESYVFGVAKSHSDSGIRKVALEKIECQKALFELARYESSEENQEYLVGRIQLRPYLIQLKKLYIKKKASPEVLKKISDQLELSKNALSFIFED